MTTQPRPLDAASRYDSTIVRWGQGTTMTPREAALWHASDRPVLRASSVVIEVLDLTPEWERLIKGHSWALGRIPRLRQRVVSDPLRIGAPEWVDTTVDLAHHLRRVRLPAAATLDDALTIAATMHTETFDPERPLWQAALVEGLPGGRAAYILKLHHAMADDHAIVALFDLLHSPVRAPTTVAPQLPPGRHQPVTPLQLTARHALHAVHRTPEAVVRLAATGARVGAALVRHPGRAAAGTAQLGRALGAGASGGSPLLRGRGPGRFFDAIEVPTERLRAAGRVAGGRAGDAMLAALVDAIGRYHLERGVPVDELPVAVPLQLRLDGRQERFPRGRISAPTATMPPQARIELLLDRIAAAESRTAIDVVAATAPALSRIPTRILGPALERAARPLALQAFVIRGLDRDAYFAGARVERMFSFGPTGGCALAATLVTHQDVSCISFNVDTTAFNAPEALGRCLRTALADLLTDGLPA